MISMNKMISHRDEDRRFGKRHKEEDGASAEVKRKSEDDADELTGAQEPPAEERDGRASFKKRAGGSFKRPTGGSFKKRAAGSFKKRAAGSFKKKKSRVASELEPDARGRVLCRASAGVAGARSRPAAPAGRTRNNLL